MIRCPLCGSGEIVMKYRTKLEKSGVLTAFLQVLCKGCGIHVGGNVTAAESEAVASWFGSAASKIAA